MTCTDITYNLVRNGTQTLKRPANYSFSADHGSITMGFRVGDSGSPTTRARPRIGPTWEALCSIIGQVSSTVLGSYLSFAPHPRAIRTYRFLRKRFWWPSMNRDVICKMCARSKDPHTLPQGLLQHLPVHSRPWSHVSVDFMKGLPASQGNSVIVVCVDCFLRDASLCHCTSICKGDSWTLPAACGSRTWPKYVVSDRVPQFAKKKIGRPFADFLVPQPAACFRDFTPNPMAKLRG